MRPSVEPGFGRAVALGLAISVGGFWFPLAIALWVGARWLV